VTVDQIPAEEGETIPVIVNGSYDAESSIYTVETGVDGFITLRLQFSDAGLDMLGHLLLIADEQSLVVVEDLRAQRDAAKLAETNGE
jgi:predicted aspartyl protease